MSDSDNTTAKLYTLPSLRARSHAVVPSEGSQVLKFVPKPREPEVHESPDPLESLYGIGHHPSDDSDS